MFWVILQRELREMLTGFTVALTLTALTVLIPLCGYSQAIHYKELREDYDLRQRIHLADNNDRTLVLSRSVPPLFPFFNGAYGELPGEFTLRSDSAFLSRSSEDLRPLRQMFPEPDLGRIIGVLLTLIAILLSHDSIAGEREQGTLKLLLAGPVTRPRVLLAKMTSIILLMGVSLAYTVALYSGTLAVLLNHDDLDLLGRGAELAAYAAFAMLMLVVFVCAGIAASTLVRSSSVSLSICIAFWVGAVLVWPSLGPEIASALWPVPSKQAAQSELFAKEAELILSELSDNEKTASDLRARNVPVEDGWRQYLDKKREWIERKREELVGVADLREQLVQRQQSRARLMVSISPSGALDEVLGSVCGTGLQDQDLFISSAVSYHRNSFIPSSFKAQAERKPWLNASPRPGQALEIEPFQSPSRSLGERLKAVAFPIAVLVTEALVLVSIALRRFRHYDLR
jgi:ABC-type transport system involved in multi-copper enzyme maturation permease subunit